MEQVSIKIDEIKINPGRRQVDENAVKELAKSMNALNLLNPIIVDAGHTLLAGLHRIEAAKLLGWTEISAFVGNFTELQAELVEIDENFVRSPLSDGADGRPAPSIRFMRTRFVKSFLRTSAKRRGSWSTTTTG